MLDKVELRIYFKDEFIDYSSDRSSGVLKSFDKYIVADGLETRSTKTHQEGLGIIETYETHSYESLPSSYSGLAFNIKPRGNGHTIPFPYVMLKCSPAKILQGHNVFGHQNLRLSVVEMISVMVSHYPTVSDDLNLGSAEIVQLDVTYSARAKNQTQSEQIIDALKQIATGQIRGRASYESTVYFNKVSSSGRSGTHIERVAYLKHREVQKEIRDLEREKSSKKYIGLPQVYKDTVDRRLSALNSVLGFSENLVRFEGRIKARKFRDIGVSVNAWEMIKLSEADKDFFKKLWHLAFDKIFEAFEGLEMESYDDKSILQSFEKLVTVDSRGRTNRRKADAARGFYFELKSLGYDVLHQRMKDGDFPRQTFYDRIKYLRDAGLSKAYITNMSGAPNVVPLIREITIDFGAQVPADYVEPKLIVGGRFDLTDLVDLNRKNKIDRKLKLVK